MTKVVVPLADLCKMDRRQVRPADEGALSLPFVGVEHVVAGSGVIDFDSDSRVGSQKSAAFRFDARHVLYGKLRPYLNKVATPGFAGKCSTELIPLLPQDGVDRDYLAHLLRRRDTVDFVMAAVTGSRMPRADMKVLLSMRVPLPALGEQRRIVAILNRAAKIERLRARAGERLREFSSAVFVGMFGDPVENLRGWDVALLGEVIQGFEAGKNVMAGNGTTPLRILKVSAVTSGEFDPSMSKPAPDDYVAPKRHRVRVGDLLISRANTSDLVGATAMVEREAPDILLPDKIWRFVWQTDSPIEPRFVHGLFQNRATRGVISAMASGTSSSMKNISQAKLKKLRIIVPPLERQKRYAELVAKAREVECRAAIAGTRAEEISASLMTELLAKH